MDCGDVDKVKIINDTIDLRIGNSHKHVKVVKLFVLFLRYFFQAFIKVIQKGRMLELTLILKTYLNNYILNSSKRTTTFDLQVGTLANELHQEQIDGSINFYKVIILLVFTNILKL